jgi:hypothetical protein
MHAVKWFSLFLPTVVASLLTLGTWAAFASEVVNVSSDHSAYQVIGDWFTIVPNADPVSLEATDWN